MQTNYWKFGVILLSLILLGGVLFFFINISGEEKSFSGNLNSSQNQPLITNTELNGEVFVVTQGSGNVKIGLAEVNLENQATKQIFKTTTNADGKFSIVVPLGSYLLNSNATRTYQEKLSGDSDKELLDKSSISKSLGETYRLYNIAILKKRLKEIGKLATPGENPSSEVLSRNFVQISEFYNWKFPLNLNQSKQSLQLSNNNLTNFGIKE